MKTGYACPPRPDNSMPIQCDAEIAKFVENNSEWVGQLMASLGCTPTSRYTPITRADIEAPTDDESGSGAPTDEDDSGSPTDEDGSGRGTPVDICDYKAHYGPFTGRGAQQKAIDAAGKGCLAVQTNRSEFHSFSTDEARDKFLEDNRSREVIERVDNDRPSRAIIDLDAPAGCDNSVIIDAINAFVRVAKSIGVPATLAHPGVVMSSRADKRSAHLISKGWRLPNGLVVRAFAKAVRDECVAAREYIDVMASGGRLGHRFGMRLPFCPKVKSPQGAFIPDSELYPVPVDGGYELTRDDMWASAWALQSMYDDEPIYGHGITPPVEDVQEPAPVKNNDDDRIEKTVVATDDQINDGLTIIDRYVAKWLSEFTRDEAPAEGTLASYRRTRSSYCSSCGRVHDSDGAYVRMNDGTLWLNCRRAPFGGKALKAVRVVANELIPADEFDELTTLSTHTFSSRYLSDETDDILKDLAGNRFTTDMYFKSKWGTGKTTSIVKGLSDALASDPKMRVLMVSMRKTLSTTLSKSLEGVGIDARDYRTIKGTFDDEASDSIRASVWQLESLSRINTDIRPFDIIVVDEIAALASHAFQINEQKQFNYRAIKGLTTLRCLLRRAKAVICADNDLTDAHVKSFQQCRSAEQNSRAIVVNNTYKSWVGTTADAIIGLIAGWDETSRRLMAKLDEENEKRLAGLPWEGCAIPCHSKTHANGIYAEIVAKYPGADVRLYTADSGIVDKIEDFKDPNASWRNALAVIYTPTLSVGVSYEEDHIRTAYAFFMRGTADACQSNQMIFRFRRLTSVTIGIKIDISNRKGLCPIDADGIYEMVTIAKNRQLIPEIFRGDCSALNPDIAPHENPEDLKRVIENSFEGLLWIGNYVGRNRSETFFIRRLLAGLTDAGCTVNITNLSKMKIEQAEAALSLPPRAIQEVSDAVAKSTVDASARNAKLAAVEYPNSLARYMDAMEHGVDDDNDSRMKTAAEYQGDSFLYTARAYMSGRRSLLEELKNMSVDDRANWYSYYSDYTTINNYKWHSLVLEAENWSPAGLAAIEGVPIAISSQAETCDLIKKAFHVIGATPALVDDEPFQITAEKLREEWIKSPEFRDVARDINESTYRVFGDRNSKRRTESMASGGDKVQVRTIVSALNVPLKRIGAKLMGTKVSSESKRKRSPDVYVLVWHWKIGACEPVPGHPKSIPRQSPEQILQDVRPWTPDEID